MEGSSQNLPRDAASSSKMSGMPRMLISYDLRKTNFEEADYEDLYAELETLGAKRIQESLWAVRTLTSPSVRFPARFR